MYVKSITNGVGLLHGNRLTAAARQRPIIPAAATWDCARGRSLVSV